MLPTQPSATFDAKVAQTRTWLQDAVQRFGADQRITQANSLGAEDMVITHLINVLALPISVFVLNTGRLHDETLALLQTLEKQQQNHPNAPLTVYHPNAVAVQSYVDAHGLDAFYESVDLRKACCHVRKVEPLGRALAGKAAWVTGLRREQSDNRADVAWLDESEVTQGKPAKINPLVDWTWGDVWHYIRLHNVPTNVLHAQFMPSIGCAPCTRAISAGEDFRAGRWWWEQSAKECGLHGSSPLRQ